jgi:hypothetical protein
MWYRADDLHHLDRVHDIGLVGVFAKLPDGRVRGGREQAGMGYEVGHRFIRVLEAEEGANRACSDIPSGPSSRGRRGLDRFADMGVR